MRWDTKRIADFVSSRDCDFTRKEDAIQFVIAFLNYLPAGDTVDIPFCHLEKISDDLLSVQAFMDKDHIYDAVRNSGVVPNAQL